MLGKDESQKCSLLYGHSTKVLRSDPRFELSPEYSSRRNVSQGDTLPLVRHEDSGSIHLSKDSVLDSAIESALLKKIS